MKKVQIIDTTVRAEFVELLEEFINDTSNTIIGEPQTQIYVNSIGTTKYAAVIFYTKNQQL